MSKEVFNSLNSGIMGGGGPLLSSGAATLALFELSLCLNRLNQPLDRLAFLASMKLEVRLSGRLISPGSVDSSPSAYAEFSKFLLNRRRMLP